MPNGLPDNILLLRSGAMGNVNLKVGFRGGINFSLPFVMGRNDVLQVEDPADVFEKDYLPFFANAGYHYAFVFQTYLNESLSLSVEPAMTTYNYKYRLSTSWTNGTDPEDFIEYETKHRSSISYIELPVVLRYEFGGNKIRPFVSLGLTYGYRISASAKMEYSVTRHTGVLSIPYENYTLRSNSAKSYIHSRFGIAPGIGFFYPLGPVKLFLSADFSFPLNNIVDESQRYANSTATTGMYNVQDDIRLGALNLTLGFIFSKGSTQVGSTWKKRGGKALECPDFKRKRK
ncbi:MAG: PorT family protein [Bacteroidales bacterium]|nr:PorT family protein [Bacteroidales bacterium]